MKKKSVPIFKRDFAGCETGMMDREIVCEEQLVCINPMGAIIICERKLVRGDILFINYLAGKWFIKSSGGKENKVLPFDYFRVIKK